MDLALLNAGGNIAGRGNVEHPALAVFLVIEPWRVPDLAAEATWPLRRRWRQSASLLSVTASLFLERNVVFRLPGRDRFSVFNVIEEWER
jgi:hypothetical protein